MAKNPSLQLGIDGTDPSNVALGDQRANAVRSALIQAGVPSYKIQTGALGIRSSDARGGSRCCSARISAAAINHPSRHSIMPWVIGESPSRSTRGGDSPGRCAPRSSSTEPTDAGYRQAHSSEPFAFGQDSSHEDRAYRKRREDQGVHYAETQFILVVGCNHGCPDSPAGLFLVESDTGKQWAVMARWFGLCNGVLRIPKTIQFPLANHKPQLCRGTFRRHGSGNHLSGELGLDYFV